MRLYYLLNKEHGELQVHGEVEFERLDSGKLKSWWPRVHYKRLEKYIHDVIYGLIVFLVLTEQCKFPSQAVQSQAKDFQIKGSWLVTSQDGI